MARFNSARFSSEATASRNQAAFRYCEKGDYALLAESA